MTQIDTIPTKEDKTFNPGDVVAFVGRSEQMMVVRRCTADGVCVDWIDNTTGAPHQATFVPEQLISTVELMREQAQRMANQLWVSKQLSEATKTGQST